MLDLWERHADMLVCTTIVKVGLNIQAINTFIVDRADVLGLLQLHQLRSRVGCSSERDYAYFLYPTDETLTQTAHEHFTTMASHADLDTGMSIIMCDLELRGAGNLPDGEQLGHIANVGFDMYPRLVGEAMTQYRGEDITPEPVLRTKLSVDAHLPDKYTSSEQLRLEIYKQTTEIRSAGNIEAVRSELIDRCGEPPLPVGRLLAVAMLYDRARELGVADIAAQGKSVRIEPINPPEPHKVRLQRLYPRSVYEQTTTQLLVPEPGGDVITWAMSLLGRVIGWDPDRPGGCNRRDGSVSASLQARPTARGYASWQSRLQEDRP